MQQDSYPANTLNRHSVKMDFRIHEFYRHMHIGMSGIVKLLLVR
jgi:hypothetical protein